MSAPIGLDQSRPTHQDWGGALLEAMTVHRKAGKTEVNKEKSRERKVGINKNNLPHLYCCPPQKKKPLSMYEYNSICVYSVFFLTYFELFQTYKIFIKKYKQVPYICHLAFPNSHIT